MDSSEAAERSGAERASVASEGGNRSAQVQLSERMHMQERASGAERSSVAERSSRAGPENERSGAPEPRRAEPSEQENRL